ncbi:MAG: hypothetical protein ABI430_03240 [Candidatus Taylorbacteria bacterium]
MYNVKNPAPRVQGHEAGLSAQIKVSFAGEEQASLVQINMWQVRAAAKTAERSVRYQ